MKQTFCSPLSIWRSDQINALENKALLAEAAVQALEKQVDQSEAIKRENKRLHDLFGSFMQSGINLSSDLSGCRAKADFDLWDDRFDSWLDLVRKAISDMGFYSDSVEFVRAGEGAEPVVGIMDSRNRQEERCRVLDQHQQKLEEIAHRRLP